MADTGNTALLTSRWGPAPVWVWALGGLVAAWVFAKWRDMKKAATGDQQPAVANPGGDYAAEGQDVAPQFIIENNMPQVITPGPTPAPPPSGPVTTLPGPPIITSPPGSAIHVPVVTPPRSTPVMTGPPKTSKPTSKAPYPYKVVHGDTLSGIAAKHKNPQTGKPFTAAELFKYNTTPGVRPASTIATLKQRGPGKIFAGETILIPQ